MQWWLWIVLGVSLLVADIALINVYFLIWFGIGAVVTGGVVALAPDLPVTAQVLLFGAVSCAALVVWLRVLRPRNTKMRLDAARVQLPGMSAAVVRFVNGRGTLRLQRPVGGRDVWDFTSEDALRPGEQVLISSVDDDGVVQAGSPPRT